MKIKYQNDIQEYITKVQDINTLSEFSSHIPCDNEMDLSIASKFIDFVEVSKTLEALHDICMEFQVYLGLDDPKKIITFSTLEEKLSYIGKSLKVSSYLIDSNKWHLLFLSGNSSVEIAHMLSFLIDDLFKLFEKQLDLRIEKPSAHYRAFLEKYYP